MKFRTEITIPAYPFNISYHDKLFFVGSCFSDHIGSFFETNGFQALSNPFGVLFNPASIELALQLSAKFRSFDDIFIDQYDDFWISFAHHGKFSHRDKKQFLENIHRQLEESYRFLKETDYLFITFGTAYCYRHIEKGMIVANCHKIPGYQFAKERLSVEEIIASYEKLIASLFQFNPKLRIIFTVSPVRHLGDGFHENQISKSTLHLAIDHFVDHSRCFYFPSYEILCDDLRDYRFYNRDLCHPGANAIEYIQEKVMAAFFDQETCKQFKEKEKEKKMKEHRILKK